MFKAHFLIGRMKSTVATETRAGMSSLDKDGSLSKNLAKPRHMRDDNFQESQPALEIDFTIVEPCLFFL